MKGHASFTTVKFRGEVVNKRCLASAVCQMVKKTLLHNGAVGTEMMSRKPHQQRVATMAGAPLVGC